MQYIIIPIQEEPSMMLTETDAREKWCNVTLSTTIAKCLATERMPERWTKYVLHMYIMR